MGNVEDAMNKDLRDILMEQSLEKLYEIKGKQYTSKGAIVGAILEEDDGTVSELFPIYDFESSGRGGRP